MNVHLQISSLLYLSGKFGDEIFISVLLALGSRVISIGQLHPLQAIVVVVVTVVGVVVVVVDVVVVVVVVVLVVEALNVVVFVVIVVGRRFNKASEYIQRQS